MVIPKTRQIHGKHGDQAMIIPWIIATNHAKKPGNSVAIMSWFMPRDSPWSWYDLSTVIISQPRLACNEFLFQQWVPAVEIQPSLFMYFSTNVLRKIYAHKQWPWQKLDFHIYSQQLFVLAFNNYNDVDSNSLQLIGYKTAERSRRELEIERCPLQKISLTPKKRKKC